MSEPDRRIAQTHPYIHTQKVLLLIRSTREASHIINKCLDIYLQALYLILPTLYIVESVLHKATKHMSQERRHHSDWCVEPLLAAFSAVHSSVDYFQNAFSLFQSLVDSFSFFLCWRFLFRLGKLNFPVRFHHLLMYKEKRMCTKFWE